MSESLSNSFYFVPEIEDEIFEHAARMYPTFAPTLALVSSRVRKRVESIIYRTISLGSSKDGQPISNVEKFAPTLQSRSAEFFADRVRNLCVTNSVPVEFTPQIFSKCTGIHNLAIWQHRSPAVDASQWIIPMSSTLRSLDTDRFTIDRLAASGCVFPHVTALSILGWPSRIAVPSLHWLPALTRVVMYIGIIGVYPYFEGDWLQDARVIVTTVPCLQRLEINAKEYLIPRMLDALARDDDKIVLIDNGEDGHDYVAEWEEWCGIYPTRPSL